MYKKFYFISGLPRSGSSLLSTILNQNPYFYSGPSSPVIRMMYEMESFYDDNFFRADPHHNELYKIIHNIPYQYYENIHKPVIFDKQRHWCSGLRIIQRYFNQKPKIICMVRNIDEIITSFINITRKNKNNFIDKFLIESGLEVNDVNRCYVLLTTENFDNNGINGIVDYYFSMKNVYESEHKNCLHFVEYKDLVRNPKSTMTKIYDFIGEDYYNHDFNNIKYSINPLDETVDGIRNLHEVRSKLEITSQDPKNVLSQDVLETCKSFEPFWRNAK